MDKEEVIERVRSVRDQHKLNVAYDCIASFVTQKMMELAPEDEVSAKDIAVIDLEWRALLNELMDEGLSFIYSYFLVLLQERMENDRTLHEFIKLN
jgi:hypothetical protein